MIKKVVIFDLYDTVLMNDYFNFKNGLKYLYETYFSHKCTYDELTKYAESFLPLYEKRTTDHVEICLIKDELPLIFEKYGVALPENIEDLEYTVMHEMHKVFLTDDVKTTLQKLNEEDVKMYILSNSIFTGKAAEKLLETFDILQYFEKVFYSADYKIRKPNKKFFEIALNYIDSNLDDIVYVGNDYNTDVKGATAIGLKTIWLNIKHFEKKEDVECIQVDDFKEILKYVV